MCYIYIYIYMPGGEVGGHLEHITRDSLPHKLSDEEILRRSRNRQHATPISSYLYLSNQDPNKWQLKMLVF